MQRKKQTLIEKLLSHFSLFVFRSESIRRRNEDRTNDRRILQWEREKQISRHGLHATFELHRFFYRKKIFFFIDEKVIFFPSSRVFLYRSRHNALL